MKITRERERDFSCGEFLFLAGGVRENYYVCSLSYVCGPVRFFESSHKICTLCVCVFVTL